jgi:hypothetical protein
MPRLLVALIALLGFALFFAACEEDDSNDESESPTPETDDDDDVSPPPSDPWNHEPARPHVEILTPQPGAFVDSSTVEVQGRVTGASVSEVFVNDEAVDAPDGQFTTAVSFPDDQVVLPIYVLAASDEDEQMPAGAGRTIAFHGEMSPTDELVPDAALVALGNQALDVINAVLMQALSGLDLLPLLEPLNPIVDTPLLKVEITAASIGDVNVDSVFRMDGWGFTGSFNNVELGLKVTTLGIPSDITMTVAAFTFQGLFDVVVDADGARVAMYDFDLAHSGLSVDGLPQFAVELVLDAVEGVLEYVVTNALPPALEGILAALTIDTVQLGFDLQLTLSSMGISDGIFTTGLDLNAFVVDPDPALPWPRGSLATPGAPPMWQNSRPPAAREFGFGASVADDLVNRILLLAADSQLLNLTIGANQTIPISLNAGTLAAIFTSLSAVDPDTPVTLALSLATPPVALAAEDGSLTLHVPDYRMDVYLDPADHDPWRAMQISLDLLFGVDVNVNDGALTLRLPALKVGFLMIDNPLNEDASLASFIFDWLPDLLGGIIDLVLSGIAIQLPDIDGLSIDPLWWGVAGENLDYWTFYFGLAYAPQ